MKDDIEKLKIEIENLKEQLRLSSELNKAYSLIISNQNINYIPYYPSYPVYPYYPTYHTYCNNATGTVLTKGN